MTQQPIITHVSDCMLQLDFIKRHNISKKRFTNLRN